MDEVVSEFWAERGFATRGEVLVLDDDPGWVVCECEREIWAREGSWEFAVVVSWLPEEFCR